METDRDRCRDTHQEGTSLPLLFPFQASPSRATCSILNRPTAIRPAMAAREAPGVAATATAGVWASAHTATSPSTSRHRSSSPRAIHTRKAIRRSTTPDPRHEHEHEEGAEPDERRLFGDYGLGMGALPGGMMGMGSHQGAYGMSLGMPMGM